MPGRNAESIIIVGAGIAGLSAGCYARMNGYSTRIFEMHDKPGGLCASWKRGSYTFDGCIHWLVGTGEDTAYNRLWKELGALQGEVVNHDEFSRVQGPGGETLVFHTDVDRLQRHMTRVSPEDSAQIKEFCGAIRSMTALSRLTAGPISARLRAGLQALPLMFTIPRYYRTEIREYAKRFRNPFLRQALVSTFDVDGLPALAAVLMLACMHMGDAGYPVGGSLAFARNIERRYLDLGGKIQYGARVEKILVEDDRAVGIRLDDGTVHWAEWVISAADGRSTIFDLLDGEYINEKIAGYYENLPIFSPLVQVSLGVRRDLSGQPHSVTWLLEDPVEIAGEHLRQIRCRHYSYDPNMAPPGRSAVVVLLPSNYAHWKAIADDPLRYEGEKRSAAETVIALLEDRLPGIAGQVEVVDVATPLTYERVTGNWQGSIEGWLLTTETMGMVIGRGMNTTLPGLGQFFMIGQWVEPGGGLPPVALSARKALARICKRDDRKFVTR